MIPLTHPPSSQCRYMDCIYLHHSQHLFKISSRSFSYYVLTQKCTWIFSLIFHGPTSPFQYHRRKKCLKKKNENSLCGWYSHHTKYEVAFSICHRGIMQRKDIVTRRLVCGQNLANMHQFKFPMFAFVLYVNTCSKVSGLGWWCLSLLPYVNLRRMAPK